MQPPLQESLFTVKTAGGYGITGQRLMDDGHKNEHVIVINHRDIFTEGITYNSAAIMVSL